MILVLYNYCFVKLSYHLKIECSIILVINNNKIKFARKSKLKLWKSFLKVNKQKSDLSLKYKTRLY